MNLCCIILGVMYLRYNFGKFIEYQPLLKSFHLDETGFNK